MDWDCGRQRAGGIPKTEEWPNGQRSSTAPLHPSELLHGEGRVPDLRHADDLTAAKVHKVGVARLDALAGWGGRSGNEKRLHQQAGECDDERGTQRAVEVTSMGSGDLGVSETNDSDGVGRDGDPTEVGTRGSRLSVQPPLESLGVFIAGLLQHESRQ